LTPLAAILILVLLAVVILVIAAPLRGFNADAAGAGRGDDADAATDAERSRDADSQTVPAREQLEAAREAKYREIRDSELDYRTGKLSPEDFAAIDSQLRAEALEILNRLEQLEGEPSA
jgi:hypothetical protein